MKTKLAFLSDIHYYSPSLGVSGRAYELRAGADQKCLAESGAILRAATEKLKTEDIDAVVVSGDVSNDGERASHEEARQIFLDLNRVKPVYLITSTHDWCTDGNARRFVGDETLHDVPTLDAPALDAFYKDFGKEALVAEYTTGKGFHSRCFQVSPTLRLLAVNDDMDGEGGKSGYSEAHLAWMEAQIIAAKAAGNDVIATEHHLLLPNVSPLINKGQSIGSQYEAAARLADAGLRLIFVGHSHFQRTSSFTSPAGNPITQVNVGSLTGWPAPIVYVDVENGKATLNVEFLQSFTYNGETKDASFIKEHSAAVLHNILNAAATNKEELRDRLGAHGIRIKPLDKIYFIIRRVSRRLMKTTVGKAGNKINRLTFGKGIDRASVKAHKNEPLLPYVETIFLALFDGSAEAKDLPDTVKTIAFDVSTLPRRIVKRLPIKKSKKEGLNKTFLQIEALLRELLCPAAGDNLTGEIAL